MKKFIALSLSAMMAFTILPIANLNKVYAQTMKIDVYLVAQLGEIYGMIDGYKAGFTSVESETFEDTMEDDLENHEDILDDYSDYEDDFLEAYEENYEKYFELGLKKEYLTEDISLTDGKLAGELFAEQAATLHAGIDFAQTIACNPALSLEKYKSEKSLYDRFYLGYFTTDYAEEFINSFENSYIDSYETAYIGLANDFLSNNINYTPINNFDTDFEFILNTDTTSSTVSISFPEGSVLGYGYVGGTREKQKVNYDTSRFLFVDYDFYIDTFNVNNFNRQDFITSYKDFTMTIDHNHVSDNVGIYEYKNGAWQYILTDISQNSVSHTFPNGNYSGGRYCLFIEPSYKTFDDVTLSPFYDEIYTYARRGALYGNNNFNPTSYITRGEISYIINGVLNPNNVNYSSSQNFSDVPSTSPFVTATNFVSANGYINGVSDSYFGANSYLTYNQLKTIIERITGSYFDMNSVFSKMKNERFYKSNGLVNMNSFVTKEEAVYILYQVLQ